MDYWFCVSVCLHVSVFSRERYNVQMLRASLSETPGYALVKTRCHSVATEIAASLKLRIAILTQDQSPGAVHGADSIHSSQRIYGLITRQTVFKFIQLMLHVVYLLLSSSKKGDHGTAFESDREGGAESLRNSFFQ